MDTDATRALAAMQELAQLQARQIATLEAQVDVLLIAVGAFTFHAPSAASELLEKALTKASQGAAEKSWEYGVAVETTAAKLLRRIQGSGHRT